jgi:hypothetical protein
MQPALSLGRAPAMQAPAGLVGLSEKQYSVPAGLARNCRFFLIKLPALNRAHSPLLGSPQQSRRSKPMSPSVGRVVESNFRLQGFFEDRA